MVLVGSASPLVGADAHSRQRASNRHTRLDRPVSPRQRADVQAPVPGRTDPGSRRALPVSGRARLRGRRRCGAGARPLHAGRVHRRLRLEDRAQQIEGRVELGGRGRQPRRAGHWRAPMRPRGLRRCSSSRALACRRPPRCCTSRSRTRTRSSMYERWNHWESNRAASIRSASGWDIWVRAGSWPPAAACRCEPSTRRCGNTRGSTRPRSRSARAAALRPPPPADGWGCRRVRVPRLDRPELPRRR